MGKMVVTSFKAQGILVRVSWTPESADDPGFELITQREAIHRMKALNDMRQTNEAAGDMCEDLMTAVSEAYVNETGKRPPWHDKLRLLLNTSARRKRS